MHKERITKIREFAADLQEFARHAEQLEQHAKMPVRVPADDAEARRLCDLTLHDMALPYATTTELAMARYLLRMLGERGTRDSKEEGAISLMRAYLLALDAGESVEPYTVAMRESSHPTIRGYMEMLEDRRDPRISAELRAMRYAVAQHDLNSNLHSDNSLPHPSQIVKALSYVTYCMRRLRDAALQRGEIEGAHAWDTAWSTTRLAIKDTDAALRHQREQQTSVATGKVE